MGTFTVRIEVAALSGDRFIATDALVDTGATYSLLPRKILRDLGVKPIDRIPFQLADERQVEYNIGEVRIRLDGHQRVAVVVFGDDETAPLIGATTLELFSLAVDPIKRRLVPAPALLK
jgi:clan AA aspartic protease